MNADSLVNLVVELLSTLQVFIGKPDSKVMALHSLVEPLCKVVVFAAVADEARIELDGLHCAEE